MLAAELIVRAVTRNVPNYRYGRFRIWGDLERSRYFDTDAVGAASLEPVVRSLSVRAGGVRLGQAFQGLAAVRSLTEADHRVLADLSVGLPCLERVSVYPEDRFEARLIYGDDVREQILAEGTVENDKRARCYLYETTDLVRAREHVVYLQRLYGGRCQICLYDPLTIYGHQVCHAHHIQWLSRGGEDDPNNLVLICPNHHAAIHQVDAPFDFSDLAFEFGYPDRLRREPLELNSHLPRAS